MEPFRDAARVLKQQVFPQKIKIKIKNKTASQ
jgi:hypothetical protein